MKISLSEHVFPHTVRYMEEEVVLYAEGDRRRITYRYVDSIRSRGQGKKHPVPKELGPDGNIPAASVSDGEMRPAIYVPELVIEWAKGFCQQRADEHRGIAAELAAMENRVNHVKIGYVFERVRQTAWYRGLSAARLDEVSRVMRWVEAELTYDFFLSVWDRDQQTRLFEKRRDIGVKSTTTTGGPTFLPATENGRNNAAKDIKNLKTIFNRALELKYRAGRARDLLDSNPMARYRLPKFGARRKREVVDHELFQTLLKHTDEVDPSGRFRFFLVMVRWLGERVSTVRRLEVGSLLFTAPAIRKAFNEQLCNYIERPRIRDKAAKLYADNGGAVFYRLSMRKPSLDEDEGDVEQYDAVVPMHPAVKPEWERYKEKYLRPRDLGRDAPLFPGVRLDRMISEGQVNSWWHQAVRIAEKRENRDIALSKGNAYHGLRYNRRTELRKAETKYARWLTGHSVSNGTPGIEISEGVYLGLKPRDLAAAVHFTDAGEDDEEW